MKKWNKFHFLPPSPPMQKCHPALYTAAQERALSDFNNRESSMVDFVHLLCFTNTEYSIPLYFLKSHISFPFHPPV